MPDKGFARIQGILRMPPGMKDCYALTMSDGLNFMGWLTYRTREEFPRYCAEHPELEPFPHDFEVSDQTHDKETEEGGGSPQGCSLYMVDLGFL